VPAPPEFGDGAREIGPVEILLQIKAEGSRHPDGDVGIARKIAVDLEGKKERSHQIGRPAVGVGVVKDGVDIDGQPVGHDQFFEKTPEHQPQAGGDAGAVKFERLAELGQEIGSAFDRPGDDIRKKRNIGGVESEMTLSGQLAAEDIDDIARGRKGVKGDPDRQHPFEQRHLQRPAQRGAHIHDGARKKVEVFESEQDADIDHQAEDQPGAPPPLPLSMLLDTQGAPPGDADGDDEQDEVLRLETKIVEKIAEQQKDPALPPRQSEKEGGNQDKKVTEM